MRWRGMTEKKELDKGEYGSTPGFKTPHKKKIEKKKTWMKKKGGK